MTEPRRDLPGITRLVMADWSAYGRDLWRYKTARARGVVRRHVRAASEPFRTKTDVYERTMVRHRQFPYMLKITALPETMQEALERHGALRLGPHRFHLTDSVKLTGGQTLAAQAGSVLQSHSRYAVEVQGDSNTLWGLHIEAADTAIYAPFRPDNVSDSDERRSP
jgi:hypothetical protein